MPRILVTNDDGINAPGLEALAAALESLGEITIVAPAEESSAVSHALTVRRPLCLTRVSESWHSVDGTLTDCVNVGITDVLGQVPDRGSHRGIRATVQGRRTQALAAMQAVRDAVSSMVWIGAPERRWEKEPASDYATIQAEWVSVTPLNTDWTNHAALPATDALARVTAADIE